MNIKLLTATCMALIVSSAIPVLSASDRDLSTLFKTGKCIDYNLSNFNNAYSSPLVEKDLRNINLK